MTNQVTAGAPDKAPNNHKLSVVVATSQPWPEIEGCLNSLVYQTKAAGVELIVADGDRNSNGILATSPFLDDLTKIDVPGGSVFQLRGRAIEQACGEWIAITEDHCEVAEDWVESILKAIDRFPDATAIGGVVDNGADDSDVNWAQFLVANGPFMSPIKNGPADTIALQANIVYRRDSLPQSFDEDGLMEMLQNLELNNEKGGLINDDSIRVFHVQSLGFKGSCAINFHNGRSIAGYRLKTISAFERLARTVSFMLLPPYMLTRSVINLIQKRRGPLFIARMTPYLAIYQTCHAFGELVGYIGGPGSSPAHMR